MNIDWSPLEREFEAWRAEARTLPVWWRDDDAIAPTQALERLLALTEASGAPITIASIPRDATPDLAARLRESPRVTVSTHGWAHENHAPSGEKSAEFGAHRPLAARLDEIVRGAARMRALFGDQATPVFTPPWNRIAPDLSRHLPPRGYDTLSTFKPRSAPEAAQGLTWINTHLDPIDWRGGRDLVPPERLVATLVGLLSERRSGVADNDEPLGLLTHHLVHTESVWSFVEQLLQAFGVASDVVLWRSVRAGSDTWGQGASGKFPSPSERGIIRA